MVAHRLMVHSSLIHGPPLGLRSDRRNLVAYECSLRGRGIAAGTHAGPVARQPTFLKRARGVASGTRASQKAGARRAPPASPPVNPACWSVHCATETRQVPGAIRPARCAGFDKRGPYDIRARGKCGARAGGRERGAPRGAECTPVTSALARAPRGAVRGQAPPLMRRHLPGDWPRVDARSNPANRRGQRRTLRNRPAVLPALHRLRQPALRTGDWRRR